ncbi:uncharacterized protein VP01_6539g1 [Puccinia sorghi]|uniref:Uncharacterized protein n=1 Tax=Puccinia sorghi TaxID=27349 RepID=A0A0L6UGA3_9BASI|nr:uncharacterized protein VP01_6539g1 [Puccinia sorghi]
MFSTPDGTVLTSRHLSIESIAYQFIAYKLRDACNLYTSTTKGSKFQLKNIEWEKVKQMIDFLQPLNNSAEFLCKSAYPTLNTAIPMYIGIMKEIISTTHFENNWQFLLDKVEVHMTPDACVSIFQTKALDFEKSDTVVPISSASQQNIKRKIEKSIFAPRVATRNLASGIQQYLKEAAED